MTHNFEHVFRGFLTIFWGKVFCFFFLNSLSSFTGFFVFLLLTLESSWYILNTVPLSEYDLRDFPGGAVDRILPASAGDAGLIPGPRRSHALREQVKPCVTTAGPAGCKY